MDQAPSTPLGAGRSRAATERALLAILIVAAASVRIALARGDLWLDEIWSLSLARHITRPWEVLTGIHHDNNHPLNTLALFLAVKTIGAHASSLAYRLLPLLTGIATVALLFWTERQTNDEDARSRAWFAAILCASSFLAIVYSSEARGYAPAALFGVVAFASLRKWPVLGTRRRAIFAIACVFGFLSHLTFLFAYAGCAVWTAARFANEGRRDWRGWVTLHRIPLVVLAGIYLVDVRLLDYGGGPPFRMSTILGRAVSLTIGGPDNSGGWQAVVVIAAIAILLYGFSMLARRRHHEAFFFATTLVLAPAAILVVYHARFLDVRYFFILMPFAWLLMARALAHLATQGQLARATAMIAIALSVIGNVVHVLPMLRYGRGHYSDVVDRLARLTPGNEIVVASDNDFRVAIPLRYYGEALPSAKKLMYIESPAKTGESVEWYITHTFNSPDSETTAPKEMTAHGDTYCLVSTFPYGGISGANWRLYRRMQLPQGQGKTFGPSGTARMAMGVALRESTIDVPVSSTLLQPRR